MTGIARPNLGLLFDIDGPLASPARRAIVIPSILSDLVALAAAGVPMAFITGRSDEFVRGEVVAPLLRCGLGRALDRGGAGMFGVFEKGAVWAPITPDGLGNITVDASVALPDAIVAAVRDVVAADFADEMFFDATKRAMVSVEQNVDVDQATYRRAQQQFADAAFGIVAGAGLGLRFGERVSPDATGAVPFRIDVSIIATDVESARLDKDRGAARALDYLEQFGPLPARWRSLGDSRSDYLMADHLASRGLDTAHVDVRPADGVLERPYPVLTMGDAIHDEAGARFLAHWVDTLGASAY